MDEIAIFNYARRYADRHERAGRGTQFPTIKQAAKRFGCRQQAVRDAIEGTCVSSIPGAEYFGIAVGVQIGGGGGYGSFDCDADHQIEAYRLAGDGNG